MWEVEWLNGSASIFVSPLRGGATWHALKVTAFVAITTTSDRLLRADAIKSLVGTALIR